MKEKRVTVKNTISPEDFAACMRKIRLEDNSVRKKKELSLEEKLANVGVPEVVIKVMASEGFDECRIPLAVKNGSRDIPARRLPRCGLAVGAVRARALRRHGWLKGLLKRQGSPNLWPMVANSWLFPIWSTERGWVQAFTARGISGGSSNR